MSTVINKLEQAQLRRVPDTMAGRSHLGLLLGKVYVLWAVNLAQTACVFLMVWVLLGIEPVNRVGLAATMVASSTWKALSSTGLPRVMSSCSVAGSAPARLPTAIERSHSAPMISCRCGATLAWS
jgi:hypothetical protein